MIHLSIPCLLLLSAALPATEPERWILPHALPDQVPSSTLDSILDTTLGTTPPGESPPRVYARDTRGVLRSLESWYPPARRAPEKYPYPPSDGLPGDIPGESTGALSGKAIYVSACHGWLWYDSLDRFSTQRGNLFDTVEDFHNTESVDQVLLQYLENAGARVFTAKERDLNTNLAYADNDGEGYSETGSDFSDGPRGFAESTSWSYGENPFEDGTTRSFPSNNGSVATWIPEVPESGYYAVYVSWSGSSSSSRSAHYRVHHPGGQIDRSYDQTVHGYTWQYMDTLWLEAGTSSFAVELIADASETGKTLSADAVRIGGGMGDISRNGEFTGQPRWEEAAVYYTQYNGAPPEVYDPWDDGHGSDPSSRSCWADWEHPAGEDSVYVSWHSNAGGGSGTDVFWYEGDYGDAYPGSEDLAEIMQEELVEGARTLWTSSWGDRGAKGYGLSEINPSLNDEMPAILIEHGFHDNAFDIEYIKHPQFRKDSARAIYRGIVRYFAEREGTTPIYLPEPPERFSIRQDTSGTLLSWTPGPHEYPYGGAALSYVIQRSSNGRSWDEGTPVSETSILLDDSAMAPGELAYFRIVASNDGGESFPSEVLGTRRSWDGRPRVLVVSAFDRLETSNLVWASYGGDIGDVVRMILPRINSEDSSVASGDALDAAGWSFDMVSNEAFNDTNLAPYDLLVWIAGEESTLDETLSDTEQERLSKFVTGGGALWATGAEILWDLDERGTSSDQDFCDAVLHARLEDDDAGTTEAAGIGLLEGLILDFGEEHGAPYPVEYPDVLSSDLAEIATYSTGGVAATLGDGVSVFGFPFECIGDEATRQELVRRLIPALIPDVEQDHPTDDTGDSGDTGDSPEDSRPEVDSSDTSSGDPLAPPGSKVGLGGGCGCSASRSRGSLTLLLALLLALKRRALPSSLQNHKNPRKD